jgi:hypothetical protein
MEQTKTIYANGNFREILQAYSRDRMKRDENYKELVHEVLTQRKAEKKQNAQPIARQPQTYVRQVFDNTVPGAERKAIATEREKFTARTH